MLLVSILWEGQAVTLEDLSIHPSICLWKLSQHTLGKRWGTSWAGCQCTTGLTQTSVGPIKFCVFQWFTKPLQRAVATVLKYVLFHLNNLRVSAQLCFILLFSLCELCESFK